MIIRITLDLLYESARALVLNHRVTVSLRLQRIRCTKGKLHVSGYQVVP